MDEEKRKEYLKKLIEEQSSIDLVYKEEIYKFIHCCFEVHKGLGRGFREKIYISALKFELKQNGIPFVCEKKFSIRYKGVLLPHTYYCDLIIYDKIVVEVKAQENLIGSNYKQLINYLAVTQLKLGVLVNFGGDSLTFRRVVL